jgi:hypothetical protein
MIAAVSSPPPGRVLRRLRPSTGGLPHAGQQAREARAGRQAETAIEFLRAAEL